MKEKIEAERKQNRDYHRKRGEEFYRDGNMQMAYKMFTISVDITPEMAYLFV